MYKYLIFTALLLNSFSNYAQVNYDDPYDLPYGGTIIRNNNEVSGNELISLELPLKPSFEFKIEETDKGWEATCFCKISYHNLTNKESATGVCLDLTSTVNTSFGGVRPQRDENVRKCNQKCTDAAARLTQQQKDQIARCACAAGMPANTPIRAYAAVGTKEYDSAAPIGSLVNDPPKYTTECQCPDTWSYNSDQKKCTKPLCDVLVPSNNQNLGNWGFIWNNKIYQNREANCVQKLVTAAFCGMY